AGLVRRMERGAGELELAAGLERDAAPGSRFQRDRAAALLDALPASLRHHPIEEGRDAAGPVVGDPVARSGVDTDLLVLGPDAPAHARLLGRAEVGDEVT